MGNWPELRMALRGASRCVKQTYRCVIPMSCRFPVLLIRTRLLAMRAPPFGHKNTVLPDGWTVYLLCFTHAPRALAAPGFRRTRADSFGRIQNHFLRDNHAIPLRFLPAKRTIVHRAVQLLFQRREAQPFCNSFYPPYNFEDFLCKRIFAPGNSFLNAKCDDFSRFFRVFYVR